MSDKKVSRLRRARRARAKIRELRAVRLCIHRTPRHMYAQLIAAEGDRVLASASTLDKDLRGTATGNVAAAAGVGYDFSSTRYGFFFTRYGFCFHSGCAPKR